MERLFIAAIMDLLYYFLHLVEIKLFLALVAADVYRV